MALSLCVSSRHRPYRSAPPLPTPALRIAGQSGAGLTFCVHCLPRAPLRSRPSLRGAATPATMSALAPRRQLRRRGVAPAVAHHSVALLAAVIVGAVALLRCPSAVSTSLAPQPQPQDNGAFGRLAEWVEAHGGMVSRLAALQLHITPSCVCTRLPDLGCFKLGWLQGGLSPFVFAEARMPMHDSRGYGTGHHPDIVDVVRAAATHRRTASETPRHCPGSAPVPA